MNGLLVAGWLMIASFAGMAAQERDVPREPPTGTAGISGRVVTTGDSPKPVRRAIVSLYGAGHPLGFHAVTDDDGRFRIDQLPGGKYALSAKRATYVTVAYGARKPGWPGTQVTLEPGQHLPDLEVLLTRGAAMTGIVRDADGDTVSGMSVVVERRGGVATDQSSARVETDHRGEFRAFGLAPGSYVVSVQPRPTFRLNTYLRTDAEVDAVLRGLEQRHGRATPPSRPAPDTEGSTASDFAPVYFPGVFAPEDAAPIVLRAGEERTGVDLTLRLMAPSRISGQVLTGDGRPMNTVHVSMVKASRALSPLPRSGHLNGDGSFQFAGVAPGRYRVTAIALAPEARRAALGERQSVPRFAEETMAPCAFATEDVFASGGEMSGVVLSLRPCLTLDVRFTFVGDQTAHPRPNPSGIRLSLEPDRTSGAPMYVPMRVPPVPGPDERFTLGEFGDVLPGTYHLRVELPAAQPGGGWWLQAATADGRDILDAPLVLTGTSPETTRVELTFTDQHSSLSGRLVAASATDYTIIAFPTNREWWRSPFRRVRTARPGTDGLYRIDDLPPGDYYLAALVEVAPDEWLNAGFLDEAATLALRLSVGTGEHKVRALQIRR